MRLLQACTSSFTLAAAQQAAFDYRYGYDYGPDAVAPGGLIPRFFVDGSQPVVKRDRICDPGTHNCLDVGFSELCCDDTNYCYVNNTGALKCCPIGSNCVRDTTCTSDLFACTETITADGTASARESCCPRKCTQTSEFLCPSSLGGACCPYGAECRSGGECFASTTASTSQSAVLTPIASGCMTSQFRCDDGEGCCNNTQSCTQVSGTGFCANPTDTSITIIDDPNGGGGGGGLSDGAKAGIAIGAVVGTSLIVGSITWLCISKRNQRRGRSAGHESGEGPGHDGMTDITSVSRNRVRRGLTQDYFGPDAVAGPYTDTAQSDATSPGPGRAVPTRPQGPGDITAPVEIDSTAVKDNNNNIMLSPMENSSIQPTPVEETIHGRFELYGSDLPARSSSSSIDVPPPAVTEQTLVDESSNTVSPRTETSPSGEQVPRP